MLTTPMRQFYLDCCLKTSGWFPAKPEGDKISLGDFGPVQEGGVLPLGNIFQVKLIDDIIVNNSPMTFEQTNWCLSSGVQASQEQAQIDERVQVGLWKSQHLQFQEPGSYFFCGVNPRASFITNWSQLQDEITLKLTISQYSFKQVWLVTDVLYFERWGLAVSGSEEADLMLSVRHDTVETVFDHFTILSHHGSQMRQSQGLSVLDKGSDDRALFFKAKKLILTQRVRDQLIGEMFLETEEDFNTVSAWLTTDLTSRLNYRALNQNNCLETFTWTDAAIDDFLKA